MNHVGHLKHLQTPATDVPGVAHRVRYAPSPHASQQVDWKLINEQRQAAAHESAMQERMAEVVPPFFVPEPYFP